MALLTAQLAQIGGTTVTYTAAAGGGDTVKPSRLGCLHVRNGGGSSINVTVVVPGNTRWGQPEPDVVVAVPAGAEKVIGPLPDDLADTDGLIDITYSGVTSVTVAMVTLG